MLDRIRSDIPGSLLIFILLLGFWVLISSSADWQHILVGIIFASILTLFWSYVTISEKQQTNFNFKQIILFAWYIVCLGYEIVKANIAVAVLVLNPKLPISPGLIMMRCDLQKDLSRVLYANSITLTPGTITVDLEGDLLIVHALTEEMAHGLKDWHLYHKMKELEEGSN